MACSSFRALLFWCREVLLLLFCQQQQQQVGWWDWKSGKGWEKHIFSRNSEGTLGNFSVRFCGMFVLPCLAVLVPGGALATLLLAAAAATAVLVRGGAFGQQQQEQVGWWDWKSGKGWEKDIFSRNSEGTLGNFSVRFCGMFVLPCLAVLVPGGALATLLLAAAAAATAVLVRGGAFGQQQQQQVSWWEIEKAEKVGKKTFFPGIQKGR